MPKTKPKKSVAKRQKQTTKAKPHVKRQPPHDVEDLLVDMVIKSQAKAVNGTDVENLIYNTTPGMAELGYGFGFSVGRELTLKLGVNSPFATVLDKVGLHNSLYHPLRDKAIITSRPLQKHQRIHLNRNIHVYEAGIISGYLSTSTGVKVSAVEKRCIYNGSSECQFIATPLTAKPAFAGSSMDNITTAIANTIREGRFAKGGEEYYRTLSYLPLIDTSISDQISKIMLISGEKLGQMKNDGLSGVVSNIANYFGVKEASTEKTGRKTIIKLRYESYNSMRAFVALPVAFIIGFANSAGSAAQVSFIKNRDNSYTTEIELEKKMK